MVRQGAFAASVLGLLGGVSLWSGHVRPLASEIKSHAIADSQLTQNRRDLVEALDRFVSAENAYRRSYGRYTRLPSKVGVRFSDDLLHHYDIHVSEASQDRLLVTGLSDSGEYISVDGQYRVQANFALPEPSEAYLREFAARRVENASIFKGYFRFEATKDSLGREVVLARGLKGVVAGTVIEFAGGLNLASLPEMGPFLPLTPGESVSTGEATRRVSSIRIGGLEIEPVETSATP